MATISYWIKSDSNSANNPNLNPISNDSAVFATFNEGTLLATGQPDLTSTGDLVFDQERDPVTNEIISDPDTYISITTIVNGVPTTEYYTFTYEFIARLPTEKGSNGGNSNDGKIPDPIEGARIALITIEDYYGPGQDQRFFLLRDYSGNTAIIDGVSYNIEDLLNGVLEAAIPLTNEYFVPCFASGTLLRTPDGDKKVEDIAAGDLVSVADCGEMRVVWSGKSHLVWPDAGEKDKPILISQGAFGVGMPHRDIVVSPQHHIVVRGHACEVQFGVNEVLAPAKGLLGLPGLRVMKGKREIYYHHVLLEKHAVVFAEGLESESFYPGPTAMMSMEPEQRREVRDCLNALKTDPENGYGPTARKKITRREAEKLVAAILADRKAKAIAAE